MTGCLQTCHSQRPPQPVPVWNAWLAQTELNLRPSLPNLFQTSYNTARPALPAADVCMVTGGCLTTASCYLRLDKRGASRVTQSVFTKHIISWRGGFCFRQQQQHTKWGGGQSLDNLFKIRHLRKFWVLIYEQESSAAPGVHCGRSALHLHYHN